MIKQFFQSVAMTCAFAASTALALPIDFDLGKAGNYTLLATGTNVHHGTQDMGSLILGSEAYIYGNVGARELLNMADGAVVYGDADYGSLIQQQGSSIQGHANTQAASAFWDALYWDLKSASVAAQSLSGISKGYINSSQTFDTQGSLSVFNILGLSLSAGNKLTLNGGADDVFIINVDYFGFYLGGGAEIALAGGLKAENVLFNVFGAYSSGHVNVAAGTMKGTYIAPDAYMQLGDGLDLDGVRFLAAGISGNLQTVQGFRKPEPPHEVPEPAPFVLLMAGLFLIGLSRRQQK